MPVVPGFLPSTSGFHFSNSTFPQVPDITINVFGQRIGIGDASNGLCGGMAFAARDYFEAGIPIPPDTANPSSGPLFDYIVSRLLDSFNLFLPAPPPPPPPPFLFNPTPPFGPGPATYMWLMNPALPDHETVASEFRLTPHGRAWITVNDAWPKIKADIDSGRPSPIAEVKIKSLDPTQMGNNHQVLAYGYDLDSNNNLVIRIYDPNYPDDDTVALSLNIGNPRQTTPITESKGATVWCFFQPFFLPPPIPMPNGMQWQADWRWCNKCQGLFFGGNPNPKCPAGGAHDKTGSGNYILAHNINPTNGWQSDWRWCNKCQGLFFGGNPNPKCPAGGAHDKTGSGNYSLLHNASAAPGQQSNWRWCNKCQSLFFGGNPNPRCPAGAEHVKIGSGDYSLIHRA